jgi:tetratricopeptide (TPR) repeat protein
MADNPRLEELKRRVLRDPASISFAALAEEYRRLGRLEEAVETCRAGLQRHPAYVSARVTLGRALMDMGDYDGATSELEQVLRVAPENLAAIRARADIHRRRGELSESAHVVSDGAYGMESEPRAAARQHVVSEPARVEVQSSSVGSHPASPALAGLESFLTAIQRARRDVLLAAAR